MSTMTASRLLWVSSDAESEDENLEQVALDNHDVEANMDNMFPKLNANTFEISKTRRSCKSFHECDKLEKSETVNGVFKQVRRKRIFKPFFANHRMNQQRVIREPFQSINKFAPLADMTNTNEELSSDKIRRKYTTLARRRGASRLCIMHECCCESEISQNKCDDQHSSVSPIRIACQHDTKRVD